jgi:hypothetical protein
MRNFWRPPTFGRDSSENGHTRNYVASSVNQTSQQKPFTNPALHKRINNIICRRGQSPGPAPGVNHLAALEQAGHRFAISELTRTECLVPVFGLGGGQRLSDFFRFFHGPNLRTLSLTSAIYARASAIRSGHTYPAIPPAQPKRYGLADALHLAAAI